MLGMETRMETRSMGSKTPCAKGSADHNYNKATPSDKLPHNDNENCNGCRKLFEKSKKRIQFGFCESDFCLHCSALNKSTFEALSACESAAWHCQHCIFAVPGVKKLLVLVGNVGEKCEALNERVTTLENNDQVSSVKVKNIVQEEVAELKEIESRCLNMICLNLPESKKIDLSERKQEDNELLVNLLQNRMEVDTDEITIDKLVRLGRSDSKNGAIKCRPLRFTVNNFEHKRQILKASSLLRKFSNP